MNFMFEWQEQYLTSEVLFLAREHKIHIFSPPCVVLFIIWRLNKRDARNQFNKGKRRESWRHWTIRQSQRWHTENTPLGSRMKWRMESTSGLVPSIIIYKQQFLQSDWLRTCQSQISEQCNFTSAKKWNWVQNSEIECKMVKLKWLTAAT